ncbi:rRNA maturation RNase YbeY [Profundibacterium mesophilum]|uniref:Endoribonuclease YbeY n=1 Tax=Profundibacterium mesophilum KAUST100406-0324 TaxID=1037889 RepID=A0A921TDI2_9RHOB|nr:rRNA maturation RNase YbeY [Profundibacterium mesophilum]KAF0676242.1 putative rRNA maturation factor [Profundibacterium mesophilum KAUST100406-0324]
MTVDCAIEDPRWEELGLETLAERFCGAALSGAGLDPAAWEISLLGCDDARIAALNADFRGKPAPTNVLSWPSEERGASMDGARPEPPREGFDAELGDIAIAYDTCAAEAAHGGIPLREHAAHLLVHGSLHLLGYDHIRDADAALMERLETEILARHGIADPYAARVAGDLMG